VLDAQIKMIVYVRSAWQQLDVPAPQALEGNDSVSTNPVEAQYTSMQDERSERIALSLSA
jgi:hypothetical protein